MPNEATLTNDSCFCCHDEKRVPYGELQGVGESRVCCFIGVNAGALAPTDQGDTLRIIPGLGCDTVYVREIVEELKARQYHRGDAAKMRIAERQMEALKRIEVKLDLLIQNANIDLPPSIEFMQR